MHKDNYSNHKVFKNSIIANYRHFDLKCIVLLTAKRGFNLFILPLLLLYLTIQLTN